MSLTDGPVAVVPPGGAPRPWRIRTAGALLAFGAMECFLALGLGELSGVREITWRLAALAAGALLAPARTSRWLWHTLALGVALVLVASLSPLAAWLAPRFVRADAPTERVDAVVVFAGAMTDDGAVGGQALDRLLSGLSDARSLGVPVVLSEIAYAVDGGIVTSRADQERLAELVAPGVPVSYVTDVESSRDEALRFAAVALARRWQRLRVVTSPLHSARACASLEAAGVAVQCAPALPRDVSLAHLRGWRRAGARLAVMRMVAYESAAWLLYRVRGWV